MFVFREVSVHIWLTLLLAVPGLASAQDADVAEEALATTLRVLDERFVDADRVAEVFTPAERERLGALAAERGLEGLAPALDERLRALGYSHTRFVADGGFVHAFYRSLFETGEPDAPAIWHLRALLRPTGDGTQRVVDVPEGGPAAAAGLRRGDLLRLGDGAPFEPARDLASGEGLDLQVQRGERHFIARLVPEWSSPHRALVEATRASARTLEVEGRRLGYLHLWTGTADEILGILDAAVLGSFASSDGIVLDLRGGFGGAWHDHLDPFFADREGFFAVTSHDRSGEITSIPTGPRRPIGHYDGPLVVLIDEGVRSGKEALAHQFRRSGRALVVGARTAGAFTAGLGTVGEGWFLYTAVAVPHLDGVRLEGTGVAPDVEVPWAVEVGGADVQFAEARRRLLACIEAGQGCGQAPADAEG